LVAAFSLFIISFFNSLTAQENNQKPTTEAKEAEKKPDVLNPSNLIMEHVMDNHEYHFAEVGGVDVAIPLPVIIYSPQRGLSIFMSSKFEQGTATYQGYKLSEKGTIEAVKEDGTTDKSAEVYDLSITRNVAQMLLSLTILVVLLIGVANKYKKNGANVAPTGFQNAVEPVITFIRDEVGKPNLGPKYEKFMPYLLTVFFFILINNIIGLVPGTANVTGNIAFTLVLAVISFFVILFSTNKHFWGHLFWPPGVPFLVKLILIPVELLGVFIKPAALMIRLFANMVAGHIVITCFVLLIFIFGAMSTVAGWGFSPVSILFTVFIYFIEILVAFIQAFIFTNLTAVFIGQAMEAPHHEEAGHH
jgi:F-type H+-transporting ATPase subunit a